jgi:fructose-1,6-bisphosphatase/inositol monophosphatase family enzyme
MRVTMYQLQDVIEYLLPFLDTAGRYAKQIQKRVGVQEDKSGATTFHQALSDADLTVQSFLEVVLLAKFPDISFFSEEQAKSLNLKYFTSDYELEVLLDPIDGTRCYIDNREHFQIIVSFHDDKELVGTILHMPRLGYTYTAVRNQGVKRYRNEELTTGGKGSQFILPPILEPEAPVLMFNSPKILTLLTPHINAKDIVVEYEANPERYNSTDILEGKSKANLHSPCQAIDGAAIALIVKEAGGVVSDFDGNPPASYRTCLARTIPNLLVAVNEAVHKELLSLLAHRSE